MQALSLCEFIQCLHWPTMKSINAGIGHFKVFQCMHWPIMKSSNTGIGPLWIHSMPALADCDVIQCRHSILLTSRLTIQSTVDMEFSFMSRSRNWSLLFIWFIQSLNTYVVHWIYIFCQPSSSIPLDRNVRHIFTLNVW